MRENRLGKKDKAVFAVNCHCHMYGVETLAESTDEASYRLRL